MYTFEYRFYPKQFDTDFIDEFDENMRWFISSLATNGQILEECQNTVKYDTYYAMRFIAPEKDSLDSKYYNKYNRQFLEDVTLRSFRAPECEFIAENYNVPDSCECDDPSHYILFTQYNSSSSPIICGDCLAPVPLYKFPKTYNDEEYFDLFQWQDTYRACEMQFMRGIGERHGYYMIHNCKSELTKEGLRFCAFFEERVGKRFYYFLYDYYVKNKKTCPKCGENWVNDDTEKISYDYVCQKCGFVSNKPIKNNS